MGYFSSIASGLVDKPINNVQPDDQLFHGNLDLINFSKCHYRLQGTFDKHYWASIPYTFEQECRLGTSLLKYALLNNNLDSPLTLWCLGMAEATLARSLSELGLGIIVGFANTGTPENKASFLAHGHPKHAHLYVGSYQKVNSDLLMEFSNIFLNGFDVIIEDTTFQMRELDRFTQIKIVKENLKNDGILILTEKFIGVGYDYWEGIKDNDFKSRYFSIESIENKHSNVLSKIIKNQVTISEISKITSLLFSSGVIFWNSGNFYSVAVSNNKKKLIEFIATLTPPCIPSHFTRNSVITPLFGVARNELVYKNW